VRTTPQPAVPAEQRGPLWWGTLFHLGPPLGFIAWLCFGGTGWYSVAAAFFTVSFVSLIGLLWAEHRWPAVDMPPPDRHAVYEGLILVFIKGVGVGGAVVVGGWWLLAPLAPLASSGPWVICLAVLGTALQSYWIHRYLNHGKGRGRIKRWYRRNHARHHAVSELDFLRGNLSSVFDTAVTGFQVPLVILSAALGMDLTSTVIAYGLVLLLQATHHTNHTFNIGWLRWVFMDNHAHKLHHCRRGSLVNHGALFTLWDRLGGTYFEDWRLRANHLQRHRIPLPIRRSTGRREGRR
jgi:sterol desaturase/sphingolipid hydroxylase (fatty acid hydroxylase superfamily)